MKINIFGIQVQPNFKNFLWIALFTCGLANSQLYIAEDYEFSTQGELSTKEQLISINSDVQGEGTLYFNNLLKQELYTNNASSLPHVYINQVAEFYNHTELFIKGNLSIVNTNAFVLHAIYIENQLINIGGNHFTGFDLIIENYRIEKVNNSNSMVLVNQNLLQPYILNQQYTDENSISLVEADAFSFYKNKFYNQYQQFIPTPPPEQIQST